MALLTNINGKFSVSDAGAVTFNNAFTFPTTDGTANYVLKTNGSGQLAWAADNDGGDINGSGTANTVTKFTGAKTIGNGPITFATNDSTFAGNLTVNARGFFNGGGSYPLQTSSTQRYNFQIRNTNNTVNSGYGWWLATDTNFDFALHADGAGDRFTLTRTGNATFAGAVVVNNMLTINIDDISTGENRGLKIYNQNSTGQQWNITTGITGVENTSFCIRDATGNVNALTMAKITGNATFAGSVTFGDSHFIGDDGDDNLLIQSSANENIIIDSADDLILDAGGNDIRFKVAGVEFGKIKNDSGNFSIYSSIENEDILFKGNDGGSTITALTLDMSEGGNATFAGNSITVDPASGDAFLQLKSSTQTLRVDQNSIRTETNTNLSFLTNNALALTLDTSQNATFAGTVETTTLRTDVVNNKANSANIIYRSGTDTIVGGGSGSNKVYVADSGDVGIGTTYPAQKLQVNGSIKIANANSRLVFGTSGGTDRRALEGNTAGTLLQIGESYSNTQMYNDVQVTGALTTGEGIVVGGSSGYQIPVAYSVGNGNITAGAIKIQLPQAMTNTMMMFKVRVYEYSTFESFDVTICGYNYDPSDTWYNVSAWIDSNANSDRNFTVRLGYDSTATRAVAYIGELSSTWTYPQVWVTEWNGGHSNQGANWHYGYQISFETSAFTGITQTITNTQINNWARAGTALTTLSAITEVQVTGNTGGSSLRLGGGVAPNGTAQIISTSSGVGGETKKLVIANSHFAFDHGSGSFTTFIGNGNYEIDARGAIIGQNMYAQGSTVGITSGGSFVFGASTSEGVYINRPANTTEMNLYTGGNPRITIESGGQVGVNNTSPSATLHLTATASNGVPFKLQGHSSTTVEQQLMYTSKAAATNWYWIVAQAASVNQLIIYGNGDIKNKNNSYGQISDVRLKENIVDAKPKLEDIKKLKVKNFNLIGDDLKQIGLIAQEVEEVFPGLVNEDKEPDIEGGEKGGIYKSVKYSVLVPILIKAMQEQQEIIDDLKSRIKQLEN